MDAQYISIFDGNPTAGGVDGVEVSQNQVMRNPAGGNIDIDDTTGIVETLAVRCASGYVVDGDVTISCYTYNSGSSEYPTPEEGHYVQGSNLIALSVDGTNYSQSITLSGVDDTNTLFYLKRYPASVAGRVPLSLRLQCEVEEAV